MPTFEIKQYELHAMKYRVEAASEAEAIAKLFAGEAEPVEQSQDMIEVADDYGLPADGHRELADALRDLGVAVDVVIDPQHRRGVTLGQSAETMPLPKPTHGQGSRFHPTALILYSRTNRRWPTVMPPAPQWTAPGP
jgi:hypothetical protein